MAKYTIHWCDNARCRDRGMFGTKDTIYTDTYNFKNDHEALYQALIIANDAFDEDEARDECYGLDNDELIEYIEDVDISGGFPVIFWVKRGSKKIYDSGLDETEWVDDEEDW